MGLGRFPISPIEARKRHLTARLTIANGEDPIEIKEKIWTRAHRSHHPLLTCHQKLYSRSQTKWSNAKHASDWQASLTCHAFPFLDKNHSHNSAPQMFLKCWPIWHTKHETARKVQNRIKLIFGYAPNIFMKKIIRHLKDHLCNYSIINGVHQVKHHRALDYKYAPSFFGELMAIETMTSKALQFTTLTAARTNETLGATAHEFDLKKGYGGFPQSAWKRVNIMTFPYLIKRAAS